MRFGDSSRQIRHNAQLVSRYANPSALPLFAQFVWHNVRCGIKKTSKQCASVSTSPSCWPIRCDREIHLSLEEVNARDEDRYIVADPEPPARPSANELSSDGIKQIEVIR